MTDEKKNGEIIIYQNDNGDLSVDVKLKDETVWLSQKQMAELFGKTTANINQHIKNIYQEDELTENRTIKKFLIVQKEGNRSVERNIDYYNLDMIISVGYRVNSKQGTEFRIWATQRLKEHIIKGYTVNQERLRDKGLEEFEKTLILLKNTVKSKDLNSDESKGLLKIITEYAQSWLLLQKYDEGFKEVIRVSPVKKAYHYYE